MESVKGVEKVYRFERKFFEFAEKNSTSLLKVRGDDFLEKELSEISKNYPTSIYGDYGILINEIRALRTFHNFGGNIVSELQDDFTNFLNSRTFDEFIENFIELTQIEALNQLPEVLRDVLDMQIGLVISFGAAFKSLSEIQKFSIEQYGDSFNQYFFSEKGYETVSGDMVVRPKLPKVDSPDIHNLKTIGNQINAERYIRDTVRIIVETSGDGLFETRERYKVLKDKFGKNDQKKKIVQWFDSFGDMAEASILPVVEEIINGAFSIELNPLLAAAIGTFCSVTARKATENAYLVLLDIPIP